ncbi:hypothetical protein D3C72_1716700 [compost metagenome]
MRRLRHLAGGDRRIGIAGRDHDLDALVDQLLRHQRRLGRIRAGVLGDELDRELAGGAPGCVDFLDRHFQALQRRLVIGCKAARLGGGKADDQVFGKGRQRRQREAAKDGGEAQCPEIGFHR